MEKAEETPRKSLSEKFLAAWTACANPDLDGVNSHFGSKFASLGATLAAVREACAQEGIGYYQRLDVASSGCLLHSSVTDGNEVMKVSIIPIAPYKTAQEFGSALTYAKRQQAQADWGITGEPDDDAEAATPRGKQAPSRGGFDAKCLSCGTAYHFDSREQYEAWLATAACCPSPNWQVL